MYAPRSHIGRIVAVGSFSIAMLPGSSQPCMAVISGADTVKTCRLDTIAFDASASIATVGANIISYDWYFGDATTGVGALTSHVYGTTGARRVHLRIADDIGCVDTSSVVVLVAQPFGFDLQSPGPIICFGDTLELDAFFPTWASVQYLEPGIPPAINGEIVDLDTSVFDIEIDGFGVGEVLVDTNSIAAICVAMEHSFMGDLGMQVICPNGQSLTLHDHQGGGTDLGRAIGGSNNSIPGSCWNYCWSPVPDHGTWAECAYSGITPNILITPGGANSGSLAPGIYRSSGSFSDLLGCPLNGTWTMRIVDGLGGDNGFYCTWAIHFNATDLPDLNPPDLITMAPNVSTSCDSTFWTGPDILPTVPCDPMVALPLSIGLFTYQITALDDFGCSRHDQHTIEVIDIVPEITGSTTPPFGISIPYAVQPVLGATYSWTVLGGAIIVGGATPTPEVAWFSASSVHWLAVLEAKAGCQGRDTLYIENVIGLSEGSADAFTIGPVPADGELILQFGTVTGVRTVQIMDGYGRTLIEERAIDRVSSIHLITSGLASGPCVVALIGEHSRFFRSFVVQHE